MARGHRGGLQQQKQGQRKAGRSLRVWVSEAQACAHPDPGLPASKGEKTRVSAAAAPGPGLSQHTHLGPTSPHTPAMGRSCPSTLYCSPPTLGPCSVTPARALESSSSFLPSDHALLPALRRAREPRPPLQGWLQSHPPARPPHWDAPRAGILLSLAQRGHPCPRDLEPTDWGPHLCSTPACSQAISPACLFPRTCVFIF